MKRWYKKYFVFDEFSNALFSATTVYIVAAIITYIAYLKGISVGNGAGIEVEVVTLFDAIVLPFSLLFTFMQIAIPPALGVWLFCQYFKKFSTLEKINLIIPVSNKTKLINIVKSLIINILLYVVTTYLINLIIGFDGVNSLYNVGLFIFTALVAIIFEGICREKKLNDWIKLIGIIFISSISISIFSLIVGLFKTFSNSTLLISLILMACCIIQFIYLLRKIENIKID